jgi:hypothetical protein
MDRDNDPRLELRHLEHLSPKHRHAGVAPSSAWVAVTASFKANTALASRTVKPNRLPDPPALHAHRVVPGVDVERRPGDVLRVVRE